VPYRAAPARPSHDVEPERRDAIGIVSTRGRLVPAKGQTSRRPGVEPKPPFAGHRALEQRLVDGHVLPAGPRVVNPKIPYIGQ
jgi:hypothetical protein